MIINDNNDNDDHLLNDADVISKHANDIQSRYDNDNVKISLTDIDNSTTIVDNDDDDDDDNVDSVDDVDIILLQSLSKLALVSLVSLLLLLLIIIILLLLVFQINNDNNPDLNPFETISIFVQYITLQ